MSKSPAGKGDRQRPTDRKKYDDAYDQIFNKKKKAKETK